MSEHRVLQVLPDSQSRKDHGDLEGPSDARFRDDVSRPAGDVAAIEPDTPRARAHAAGDEVEKGGLAGPVRADDRVPVALMNLEVHRIHRAETAEAPAQALELEEHPSSFYVLGLDGMSFDRTGHVDHPNRLALGLGLDRGCLFAHDTAPELGDESRHRREPARHEQDNPEDDGAQEHIQLIWKVAAQGVVQAREYERAETRP